MQHFIREKQKEFGYNVENYETNKTTDKNKFKKTQKQSIVIIMMKMMMHLWMSRSIFPVEKSEG